jgi:hypothetical protein
MRLFLLTFFLTCITILIYFSYFIINLRVFIMVEKFIETMKALNGRQRIMAAFSVAVTITMTGLYKGLWDHSWPYSVGLGLFIGASLLSLVHLLADRATSEDLQTPTASASASEALLEAAREAAARRARAAAAGRAATAKFSNSLYGGCLGLGVDSTVKIVGLEGNRADELNGKEATIVAFVDGKSGEVRVQVRLKDTNQEISVKIENLNKLRPSPAAARRS